MPGPRIIVTGASGFIGRHLLDVLKERYRIVGMARRSQAVSGAPVHPNISWFQVDIGERAPLEEVFRQVAETGGAEMVIHLAAHYDFTGEQHPEYWRTNVNGLRNVLDLCRSTLRPRRFIFVSSVAACALPPPGAAITEATPALGKHIYSITKHIGEEMLAGYADAFPSVIVRLAALFSDWCEYPPLFFFLGTWLSSAWNARILGGRGRSAIPYLHIRDAVGFLRLLLERVGELAPGEIVMASNDGAVSHHELYEAATLSYYGYRRRPVLFPKVLCGPAIWGRDTVSRVLGERPFERAWMARYIDRALTVDASRTRARLGWCPTPRLEIVRRLPFLIENLKTDPLEWNKRNRAALKKVRIRDHVRLHALLERNEAVIRERLSDRLLAPANRERFPSYPRFSPEEHRFHHRLVLQRLLDAVRTREKAVFMTYCRDLAERRIQQGFTQAELCAALETLNTVCIEAVGGEAERDGLHQALHDYVTTTIQFGIDQMAEVYEQGAPSDPAGGAAGT